MVMPRFATALVLCVGLSACARVRLDPIVREDAALGHDATDERADVATTDGEETAADGGSDAAPEAGRCPDESSQRVVIALDEDDGQISIRGVGWVFDTRGETPPNMLPRGIYMGYWNGGATWGFFRFSLRSAVPASMRIADARLRLWGIARDGDWNRGQMALEVRAERAATALPVSSAAQRPFNADAGVTLTDARVRWPIERDASAWAIDALNESPDLSPLIRELQQQFSGFAAGASLRLWIAAPAEDAFDHEVAAHDVGNAVTKGAQLELVLCPR
jgi:hypothetical protein